MIEMTLSSRHRIRNSSPGGLRPSTPPLGHEVPHNTDFHTWMGKKHFCFFQTAETGNRTPNSGVKGSGANHYPRAPALEVCKPVLFITISLVLLDLTCLTLKRHFNNLCKYFSYTTRVIYVVACVGITLAHCRRCRATIMPMLQLNMQICMIVWLVTLSPYLLLMTRCVQIITR